MIEIDVGTWAVSDPNVKVAHIIVVGVGECRKVKPWYGEVVLDVVDDRQAPQSRYVVVIVADLRVSKEAVLGSVASCSDCSLYKCPATVIQLCMVHNQHIDS